MHATDVPSSLRNSKFKRALLVFRFTVMPSPQSHPSVNTAKDESSSIDLMGAHSTKSPNGLSLPLTWLGSVLADVFRFDGISLVLH